MKAIVIVLLILVVLLSAALLITARPEGCPSFEQGATVTLRTGDVFEGRPGRIYSEARSSRRGELYAVELLLPDGSNGGIIGATGCELQPLS